MDQLNKFYVSKNKNYGSYNFDLQELTKNFSFFDFVYNARKATSDGLEPDFSGFLVCTPKQYIVGYTSDFGKGSHHPAFGRAYKDIHGGGEIVDTMEIARYSTECKINYLCARIHFDSVGMDEFGMPVLDGGISIMSGKKISPEIYETFKKFCEDYAKDINMTISNNPGRFHIGYYDSSRKKSMEASSLDEVITYLEREVDPSLSTDEEEIIIGIPTNEKALN